MALVGDYDSSAIIISGHSLPVLRGNGSTDYACGACHAVIAASLKQGPRNVPNAFVGSGGLWQASTPRGGASGGMLQSLGFALAMEIAFARGSLRRAPEPSCSLRPWGA